MTIARILVVAFLAALLSPLGVIPASAQVVEGEEHCVINVKSSDVQNVRSRPSASARVVTSLRYGQCGVIVTGDCRGSWCPVEDGHNSGWVNSRYISMVSPAMYCVTGVARGDGLNLRAFPAPTSRVLTVLSRRQCEISFLPYAVGGWQKVRAEGYEGWVNRRFLSGE